MKLRVRQTGFAELPMGVDNYDAFFRPLEG